MDCRVRGERSDAVLRTAMPGNDEGRKKETIEGSGTPTDAVFHVRTSGCGARHGEVGLRRPSAAGALACRRSTDGSCPGNIPSPKAQLQARLPGTRTECSLLESRWGRMSPVGAGVTNPALSQSSGSTPQTSPSAGLHDAQSRPGAGRNAARGHRTRSGLQVYLPKASFMSEIRVVRCN